LIKLETGGYNTPREKSIKVLPRLNGHEVGLDIGAISVLARTLAASLRTLDVRQVQRGFWGEGRHQE
jgi:hypothetical protein